MYHLWKRVSPSSTWFRIHSATHYILFESTFSVFTETFYRRATLWSQQTLKTCNWEDSIFLESMIFFFFFQIYHLKKKNLEKGKRILYSTRWFFKKSCKYFIYLQNRSHFFFTASITTNFQQVWFSIFTSLLFLIYIRASTLNESCSEATMHSLITQLEALIQSAQDPLLDAFANRILFLVQKKVTAIESKQGFSRFE